MILDNRPSHKSAKAEAILKQRGAWFLFLTPYSPDLNPIEMAIAKLKAHLRRIGARTIDALWRAIGDISALYSEQECWNYLVEALEGALAEAGGHERERFDSCRRELHELDGSAVPAKPIDLTRTAALKLCVDGARDSLTAGAVGQR